MLTKLSIEISIYGGLNEIGGNKILLKDNKFKKSIFLDFGKNFSISRKFYEFPFSQPESIQELINIEAIPNISNLYTKTKPGETKFEDSEPPVDAVFVSHGHLDHIGHVPLLNRNIPIYLGECTKNIVNAMGKIAYRRKQLEFFWNGLQLNEFKTGEVIDLGDISIKPIHVDHSIPGAYGFIIYTSKGVVAYTGDIRMHGPEKKMSEEFVEELEKEDVEVLIIEGTKIDNSNYMKEEDVEKQALEVVERAKNLVITDFSRTDYDRFKTFYKIAKQLSKKLVIEPKMAWIIKTIGGCPNISKIVNLDEGDVYIFKEEKKRLTEGEKEILNIVPEEKLVGAEELLAEPSEYILLHSINTSIDLKRIKPPKGSIYILSSSEPVDEEREITFEKIMNWMELLGLTTFHIHASGHATPLDLRDIIEKADPNYILPIHTLRPQLMVNFIGKNYNWLLPKTGEKLLI